MKREDGFYWVFIEDWKIAEWDSGNWYLPGVENIFEDNDFTQIIEVRLTNASYK